MDIIAFIFYYITPYVAVIVFFGGIAYQLYRWSRKPPVAAHLSLYPRPQGHLARFIDAVIDMFTLKGLFKVNKALWLGGFVMHLGLLLILFGHIRAFADFYFLWDLLGWGEEQVHLFSGVAGTIAGILFTIPLFYLLARRWSGPVKWLSKPEDFALLFLLIGIGFTGFHMRLLTTVQVEELHHFFGGLALFNWQVPPASAGDSFIFHFALVQALMIYFPFSKLMHTIGTLFAKMVARS
ncbi:MAG: respiratory nitrate reductase subunit gamma [Chloroflexi bacterium]|nr:respiratory nitrate reductase subunit gamma [Chloroflexota bacterium]MBU1747636.1 respiratory nitrate reductase subunit gamma [Chloroflexota bacterium]MBU1879325.1 respiratory nitrate reductase subunit gamma [Chloroflexota bacterium]